MPTQYGHFHLIPFRQTSNGWNMAIIKGEWEEGEPILVKCILLAGDSDHCDNVATTSQVNGNS